MGVFFKKVCSGHSKSYYQHLSNLNKNLPEEK